MVHCLEHIPRQLSGLSICSIGIGFLSRDNEDPSKCISITLILQRSVYLSRRHSNAIASAKLVYIKIIIFKRIKYKTYYSSSSRTDYEQANDQGTDSKKPV